MTVTPDDPQRGTARPDERRINRTEKPRFLHRGFSLSGPTYRRLVGTQSSNRTAWEIHFRTRSVCRLTERTRPGAQMTVWQILKTAPFTRLTAAERHEWLKMAFYTQLVALGLQVSFIQYDLIVLQKT